MININYEMINYNQFGNCSLSIILKQPIWIICFRQLLKTFTKKYQFCVHYFNDSKY